MFGRRKSGSLHPEEFVARFIGYQVETEKMKDAARSSERSVAILKPKIPIGIGGSAGWFGGSAALPAGMAWPEQNGKKLLFVGQIDLSALPQDLWSGVGPRSGWLGIFLPAEWPPNPTVLHFDGPLVEVKGPLPNSADWTRAYDFKATNSFALPKWPLTVDIRFGHELHEAYVKRSTKEPSGTLLDPAYHPFDRETVSLLCTTLGEAVTEQVREIVRFPAMRKLRPADAAWFASQRQAVLHTFIRFFEIEGRIRSIGVLDAVEIAEFIEELAGLYAYDMRYLRNDAEGCAELELHDTRLLDAQLNGSELRSWWCRYEAGLRNHAMKAYTSMPSVSPPSTILPLPLVQRLEREWQSQTRDGLAAMGHAPIGHIYTPHGPDSPNEVLLELYTSNITGFIWGDCYSLVLLMDRQALRRGDFSKVMFDITN
ncbi:DUF1963 domain-containing protein [Rhodopseudomonas sp.]|uniref:DUF1963 domain-containing protein n=1 Tax=Rhodopseudomonas sp. TaxID=1078 RepID=UPI0039E386EE